MPLACKSFFLSFTLCISFIKCPQCFLWQNHLISTYNQGLVSCWTVSCFFQPSKGCNIKHRRSERFSSTLRHEPEPPTKRPSQPFTQSSLLHSKLTSSSRGSAEHGTGERHIHGMGQLVWHKAPHLNVSEQKAETGGSSRWYLCVCVCLCRVLFTELYCHMSSSLLFIPSLFFSSVAKPAWGRDTLCRFHPLA